MEAGVEWFEALIPDSSIADFKDSSFVLQDDRFSIPVRDLRGRDDHPDCCQIIKAHALSRLGPIRSELVAYVADHMLNAGFGDVDETDCPLDVFLHLLRPDAYPAIEHFQSPAAGVSEPESALPIFKDLPIGGADRRRGGLSGEVICLESYGENRCRS